MGNIELNETNESTVEYGHENVFDYRATDSVSVFQDDGTEKSLEYIHHAVLHNLQTGKRYCKRQLSVCT
jgi:hypothetical protein